MLSMPGPKFITPHEAKRVKTFHWVGYFVVWISIVWGFITLAQNVPSPLFIILEAIFLIGFFAFLSFLSRDSYHSKCINFENLRNWMCNCARNFSTYRAIGISISTWTPRYNDDRIVIGMCLCELFPQCNPP